MNLLPIPYALALVLCVALPPRPAGGAAVTAVAEGRVPDFVGIPWGATRAQAKAVMTAREGVKFSDEMTAKSRLRFSGGVFAGQPAMHWGLEFVGDRFYKGYVILKPVEGAGTEKQFRAMKEQFIAKYGRPTEEKTKGTERFNFWKLAPSLNDPQAKLVECSLFLGPEAKGQLRTICTYANESLRTSTPVGDDL